MSYIPDSPPITTDPNMAGLYTKFLCHCDGTNGQTTNTDNSLFALPMTFSGTAQVSTTQKKFGTGSFKLNGASTDYVHVDNSSGAIYFGTNDFTIECWVWPGTNAGYSPLLVMTDSTGHYGPVLTTNSGGSLAISLMFAYDGSTLSNMSFAYNDASVAMVAGAWNHVAFCRDNNYLCAYINGVETTNQKTLLRDAFIITASDLYIGAAPYGAHAGYLDISAGTAFNGYIDEVRITCGLCRYPAGPFNISNPQVPSPFTPPISAFTNPSAISTQSVGNMYVDGANTVWIDNPTTKHRTRLNTIGTDERYLIG